MNRDTHHSIITKGITARYIPDSNKDTTRGRPDLKPCCNSIPHSTEHTTPFIRTQFVLRQHRCNNRGTHQHVAKHRHARQHVSRTHTHTHNKCTPHTEKHRHCDWQTHTAVQCKANRHAKSWNRDLEGSNFVDGIVGLQRPGGRVPAHANTLNTSNTHTHTSVCMHTTTKHSRRSPGNEDDMCTRNATHTACTHRSHVCTTKKIVRHSKRNGKERKGKETTFSCKVR